MARELRRKNRGMAQAEARKLLERGEYGILSTCGPDGRPYGIPLSYCVLNDAVYFHCALEGHKLDNIEGNDAVSFCVVGETEVLPAQFATRYESVVLSGRAVEVFGEEKQQALEGLVEKYSADFWKEGQKYIEAMDARTRVFRIGAETVSGKARR